MIYDKATGRSRGFGYVTLSSVDEVEAAAKQFNGYVSYYIVFISNIKLVYCVYFLALCVHFHCFALFDNVKL